MFKFKYSAENAPRAWFFLLPALALIAVFNVLPLIRTLYMSFQKGSLTNPQYNDIQNYITVLNDTKFHTALINTSIYSFVVVPVALALSLLIAITIYEQLKFKDFFETIFFIPYLTSMIAVGVVFRFLLNGDYGMVNYLLGFIGIGPIDFLNNPDMAITTIIIFGIWSGLAFNIII